MPKSTFYLRYTIDKEFPTPVYIQLVRAVVYAIQDGFLKKGQVMPSINSLSSHYLVTRSTIEKGYAELRDMGILGSHHGKGFFVKDTEVTQSKRILFLANTANNYQRAIYDSFSKTLGPDAKIEVVIYDNDPGYFTKIMKDRTDDYSHYFIIPYFSGDGTQALRLIDRLPKHKLVLFPNHQELLV